MPMVIGYALRALTIFSILQRRGAGKEPERVRSVDPTTGWHSVTRDFLHCPIVRTGRFRSPTRNCRTNGNATVNSAKRMPFSKTHRRSVRSCAASASAFLAETTAPRYFRKSTPHSPQVPPCLARGGKRDAGIAGLRGSGDRIAQPHEPRRRISDNSSFHFSGKGTARGLSARFCALARYCPREQGTPLPAVVCGGGLLTYFGERKRQGMERLPSTRFAAPGLRVGSGGRGVTGNVA